MPDFKERNRFSKPTSEKQEFLDLVKSVRHAFDDELKTIFTDKNLQKRLDAYNNLKKLEARYQKRLLSLPIEEQKALIDAIRKNEHKVEVRLKNMPVGIYLTLEGVHLPFLSLETGKPFSLLDFFQTPYLSEKEVEFRAHFPKFNIDLFSEVFPGMDNGELQEERKENEFKHILLKTEMVAYDIIFTAHKGCDIKGEGKLKNFSKHLHYDIPKGEIPGDIHVAFDKLLQGGSK